MPSPVMLYGLVSSRGCRFLRYDLVSKKMQEYLIDEDSTVSIPDQMAFAPGGLYGWVTARRKAPQDDLYYHIIYRTTNGGQSRRKQLDTFMLRFMPIHDVVCIDENRALALDGLDSKVWETTDGGRNWRLSTFPEQSPIVGLFARAVVGKSSNYAFMMGMVVSGGVPGCNRRRWQLNRRALVSTPTQLPGGYRCRRLTGMANPWKCTLSKANWCSPVHRCTATSVVSC